MNRNIVLAVCAATLMRTLRAESPLVIRIDLGNPPVYAKAESKETSKPKADVTVSMLAVEKSQPKVEESGFVGQCEAAIAALNARLKELVTAHNQEIETYKPRLLAHFDAKLKAAQDAGNLNDYEQWHERKDVIQELQTFQEWAYILNFLMCERRDHYSSRFYREDFSATFAPDIYRYRKSVELAYQETDKVLEGIQRDAMRAGKMNEAKAIRDYRLNQLSREKEQRIALIIGERLRAE